MPLCLCWRRGAVSGLLTCQRRLWVHLLMRRVRLRQRRPPHLPQTNNKKCFRPAAYLRSANCFFRSSIKCCAPSCVRSSPDLSGTSAFWQRVLSSSRWASVMIESSIARSYTLAFSRILSIIFDACAFQIVVAGLLAQGLQIRSLRTGHRIIAREPLVRIFLGGTAFQQTRGWAVSDRDVHIPTWWKSPNGTATSGRITTFLSELFSSALDKCSQTSIVVVASLVSSHSRCIGFLVAMN